MDYNKYDFNEASSLFLKRIERDYDVPINIVRKRLAPSEHGFSKVTNGIPTIEISEEETAIESLIIHEAFHLRLRYDGMPDIGFELPLGNMDKSNQLYLEWFSHLYWDKITHHFFYSRMAEDLAVDPYKSFSAELEDTLQCGEIKNLNESTKEIALAGYYVQTWIETQDKDYLQKFQALILSTYSGIGIELGKKLLCIVQDTQLNTFEDCLNLFRVTFNIIHEPQSLAIIDQKEEIVSYKNYTQSYTYFSIGKSSNVH